MKKPYSIFLKSALTLAFACATVPAFAQHGGGGHGGGGFHGGGGGMRSSGGGGGRSFAQPAAGYGGGRSYAPAAPRYGGGYAARPGGGFARPGGNYSSGGQRGGNPGSAPNAAANGQWHSFGGARGTGGAQSQAGSSGSAGGFRNFSGNRGTAGSGTVRSFSGQGREIYENTPAASNMVSRSQSLATVHNSFVGSGAASAGLRPNASLSASSRFAGGSASPGNRGFGGGVGATNRFGIPFGGNRWGYGRGFGRGWGYGGYGGFGFGGWGFGWPGFGFYGLGWDPFLYDPWWGGGFGLGYGYGYPYNYVSPDPGYYGPDYDSAPPPQQEPDNSYDDDYQGSSNGNTNGNWITPNEPRSSSGATSSSVAVPVLIYMKNGKILTVRDYWMVDGELHYILMSGVQNAVDLEQIDLARTNTENAKSGVKFIFKSEPNAEPPAPDPAPTQELNAIPQPEATT